MVPLQGRTNMTAIRKFKFAPLAALFVAATMATAASAQEIKRTEIKRSDLTGTNMEVVMAIVEIPPGAVQAKTFHFGEEDFYVLEGAMTEVPGTGEGQRA